MRSNSELIRAVVIGTDRDAFTQLILRYERLVWTVAWRELGDYHATEDVTQETFLIAHGRLSQLRDPDSIGFWLSRIARREATRLRKLKRDAKPIDEIELADERPSRPVPLMDEGLLNEVARLPEHERIVTVLRFLSGHSVAEVASLTGRPVGTVTKQLSRAIGRLRIKLESKSSAVDAFPTPSRSIHVQ